MEWLKDRLSEPSTFTALAVFLACGGLFYQSNFLDPQLESRVLLAAATLAALLGLIGKDRRGPLL